MSAIADRLEKRTQQALVRACWSQWRAVKGVGSPLGTAPLRSIIDPEALLLGSLAMREQERRLQDELGWWLETGAELISVQRLRTIARLFPDSISSDIGWFAQLALESGDARWRTLVTSEPEEGRVRPGKGPSGLQFIEPSTLMLRLRAGFGVGAKADLLAFLIGMHGSSGSAEAWIPGQLIAEFTSYSRTSVLRATAGMVLARLVEQSADSPPMFSVDLESWARLLELQDPSQRSNRTPAPDTFDIPAWRHWPHVFAFFASAHAWAKASAQPQFASEVVQASRARDIVERFERVFVWTRIAPVDVRAYPGESFLSHFEEVTESTIDWMERSL